MEPGLIELGANQLIRNGAPEVREPPHIALFFSTPRRARCSETPLGVSFSVAFFSAQKEQTKRHAKFCCEATEGGFRRCSGLRGAQPRKRANPRALARAFLFGHFFAQTPGGLRSKTPVFA